MGFRSEKRILSRRISNGRKTLNELFNILSSQDNVLTEVSVPSSPAAIQFQRNTQRPTLIINQLAYQFLSYSIILVYVSHMAWYLYQQSILILLPLWLGDECRLTLFSSQNSPVLVAPPILSCLATGEGVEEEKGGKNCGQYVK